MLCAIQESLGRAALRVDSNQLIKQHMNLSTLLLAAVVDMLLTLAFPPEVVLVLVS